MTIEQPASRPISGTQAHGSSKMYAGSANMFHDYILPQSAVLDHSLQPDLQVCASSPNSLSFYEHFEMPCMTLGSNEGTGTLNDLGELDEFDLKTEIECSNMDLKTEMPCDDLLNLEHKSREFRFEDIPMRDLAWSPSTTGDPAWSPTASMQPMKMDDVFQVDRSRATQGPTLAELNSDQSMSLLDDVETVIGLDSHYIGKTSSIYSTDVKPDLRTLCKLPSTDTGDSDLMAKSTPGTFCLFPRMDDVKMSSSMRLPVLPPEPEDNKSSLQQLLAASPPAQGPGHVATPLDQKLLRPHLPCATITRLGHKRSDSPGNESTGSNNSMDRKWEEIKQFIHDDLAMAQQKQKEQKSESHILHTAIKVEPEDPAFTVTDDVKTAEEEYESDSDESEAETYIEEGGLSDAESMDSHASFSDESPLFGSKKGKRYFWQYNTQSKGPKGKRLCKSVESYDPHVLHDFEDPVFDPELNQSQYKHNGKARRGDGNDITPNPQKLYQIGNELRKLNRTIHDLTPVSELPVNVRPKSRKEKNKLASRACRLKKKAQHEANKVKLFGLHREHEQLMDILALVRDELEERLGHPDKFNSQSLTSKVEDIISAELIHRVAGKTTEFVNTVLSQVAAGDPKGGLQL